MTPELLSLLVELHNLVAAFAHRSPAFRVLVGGELLALLRRIAVASKGLQ